MELQGESADMLYREVLRRVGYAGKVVAPRGEATKEVIGAHLVLDNPYRNIVVTKERKVNYHFMVAEWLWIMLGLNDLEMILPYNKVLDKFSDDGETLRGAYGPKLVEQLPYVYEVLTADPYSRQAIITLWRERPRASKDIPCTISFQFLLRDVEGARVLDMLTYMRSNDAWLGLPYDLFTFTMLQQVVASKLLAVCGQYHHMVGSLHLYEQHLTSAQKVARAPHVPRRDHVTQHMFPLTFMPPAFRSVFIGLTLMARAEEDPEEIKAWLVGTTESLPPDWANLLSVLAHRFHKDDALLLEPWKSLVTR